MRIRLLSSLIFISIISSAQVTTTLVIEPQSTFSLRGVSNVNTFSCEIVEGFCGEELNVCFVENEDIIEFENTQFSVSVDEFDCRNRYITRDMKKALKQEAFPLMNFKLLSISRLEDNPLAEMLITISGKSNFYHLKYSMERIKENTYRLNLNSEFYMQDFDIEPPSALLGLIKVANTIEVDIELVISNK